jgi:hypothetical protein
MSTLGEIGQYQQTYTINGNTTAGNYADTTQWIVSDGSWKSADAATVTWTDGNNERIEVIEKALLVLADMMEGSGQSWEKVETFLEIVKGLREEEVEEKKFEDHIDPDLFEIKDDF